MKQQSNTYDRQAEYNKQVKLAYYKVLTIIKGTLAGIEQEELRFTLEREYLGLDGYGIIHEFINPLLYMRLEHHETGDYSIHWGIDAVETRTELSDITSKFIRMIYGFTDISHTALDITHSVKTDWLIKNCGEMFDYIMERNKHHTFRQLKHKKTSAKRKQMQAVA